MFGDDACSTISSATMLSEFGGDEEGSDDGGDVEVSTEFKYVPPEQQSGEVEIDVSSFKQVVIKVERVKRAADEEDEEEEPPPQTRSRKKKILNIMEKGKQRVRLRKQRDSALERTKREEEGGGNKRRRPPPKRRSVAKVKVEVEVKNEVDGDEEEGEKPKKRRRRRRKKSERGDEDLEATRAKARDWMRLKRALQREQMTEEEREAMLEKQREQRRKSREKARLTMSPEQRREEAQRESLRRLEKLAGMTEEERRMERMSKYLGRMANVASIPEEELEERKRRRQEYLRRRREGMTEEDLERRRRNLKRYRDNMGAERKQRFLEKLREGYQRRKERMKEENPNRTWRVRRPSVPRGDVEVKRSRRRRNGGDEVVEEEDEEQKQRRLLHRRLNAAKCNLRSRLRKRGVSPEEIEARVRRLEENYEYKPSRRNVDETEEEKRERIRSQRSLIQKKSKLKRKLKLQKLVENGVSVEEANERLESPEKRERALIRMRLNWHRANLRKRLEQSGASPEEIQLRVQELEKTYQPTNNFRPYRPRLDARKPIDPSDLALIAPDSTSVPSPTTSRRGPPRRPQKSSPEPSTSFPHTLTPVPDDLHNAPSTHAFYQQTQLNQNHLQVHYHQPPGGESHPQQQPDYSSSFDDADNHSPPTASPQGGDGNDYSSSFVGDYSTQHTCYPPPPTHPVDHIETPRNEGISNPKKGRLGPRGLLKKSEHLPDTSKATCELCGNDYPAAYLSTHKNLHHNPNFQNQACGLCGEKFTAARVWYAHYKQKHGGDPLFKKKSVPAAARPHLCDDCGASFSRNNAMQLHKYKMHGDGLKKENYQRCPICPDDKMYKTMESLEKHLSNKHLEYWRDRMRVECFRCEERFRTELALARHVKACHVESYFPCGYCEAVRFSRVGLEFHWMECKKVGRGRREEMRTKEGIVGFAGEEVECEFCGGCVRVRSMTKHLRVVHGLREEEGFTCVWCGRGFRRREFWGVHMEEMHGRGMEEVRDMVRRWSRVEREGMEVKNREGCFRGLKGKREEVVEGIKVKRRVMVIAEEDEENEEEPVE